MKWEMEIDEIEAVLEKIWDLHDKLSDAIHSISRAHFLSTVKNHSRRKRSDDDVDDERKSGSGYVYVKGEYRVDDDEPAVHEAKSLYSIRTALENLEDQLDFFHTVQTQQRAERDAAIARLEQSRIILAMRLAEHQGKKYKVIEEALALVGDVRDASRFVSPEHVYNNPSGQNSDTIKGNRPNPLLNFFLSGFTLVSRSIKLDHTVGILGNAALLAISMIAFVSLNQLGCKEKYEFDDRLHGRETRSVSRLKGTISGDVSHLDVKLARG